MIAFVCFSLSSGEDGLQRLKVDLGEWGSPIQINHWSTAETSEGPVYQKTTRDRISRADLMIVLLDAAASGDVNVSNEIALAKGANVPFFGIRAPEAPTPQLPPGLAADRVVQWQASAISGAIGQLMKEGKHHKFR